MTKIQIKKQWLLIPNLTASLNFQMYLWVPWVFSCSNVGAGVCDLKNPYQKAPYYWNFICAVALETILQLYTWTFYYYHILTYFYPYIHSHTHACIYIKYRTIERERERFFDGFYEEFSTEFHWNMGWIMIRFVLHIKSPFQAQKSLSPAHDFKIRHRQHCPYIMHQMEK